MATRAGHSADEGDIRAFFAALDALSGAEEYRAFFADVSTPRELTEMAQRLEVARLLSAGEPYATIQQRTGASATTIARVSRCLQYGDGGYQRVLDRLREQG